MNPYTIIIRPLVTEKAIDKIEKENKLSFVVSVESTKDEVKKAIEELYAVKVADVNTHVGLGGKKKAVVQLSKESSAADVAAKLGVV